MYHMLFGTGRELCNYRTDETKNHNHYRPNSCPPKRVNEVSQTIIHWSTLDEQHYDGAIPGHMNGKEVNVHLKDHESQPITLKWDKGGDIFQEAFEKVKALGCFQAPDPSDADKHAQYLELTEYVLEWMVDGSGFVTKVRAKSKPITLKRLKELRAEATGPSVSKAIRELVSGAFDDLVAVAEGRKRPWNRMVGQLYQSYSDPEHPLLSNQQHQDIDTQPLSSSSIVSDHSALRGPALDQSGLSPLPPSQCSMRATPDTVMVTVETEMYKKHRIAVELDRETIRDLERHLKVREIGDCEMSAYVLRKSNDEDDGKWQDLEYDWTLRENEINANDHILFWRESPNKLLSCASTASFAASWQVSGIPTQSRNVMGTAELLSSNSCHFGNDQDDWECGDGTGDFAVDSMVDIASGSRDCEVKEDGNGEELDIDGNAAIDCNDDDEMYDKPELQIQNEEPPQIDEEEESESDGASDSMEVPVPRNGSARVLDHRWPHRMVSNRVCARGLPPPPPRTSKRCRYGSEEEDSGQRQNIDGNAMIDGDSRNGINRIESNDDEEMYDAEAPQIKNESDSDDEEEESDRGDGGRMRIDAEEESDSDSDSESDDDGDDASDSREVPVPRNRSVRDLERRWPQYRVSNRVRARGVQPPRPRSSKRCRYVQDRYTSGWVSALKSTQNSSVRTSSEQIEGFSQKWSREELQDILERRSAPKVTKKTRSRRSRSHKPLNLRNVELHDARYSKQRKTGNGGYKNVNKRRRRGR